MTAQKRESFEQRLVVALSHPLRVKVIEALSEGDKPVASPVELSKMIGEELHKVAYHMRVLWENGFLELTHTRPRRGATEHFYRVLPQAHIGHEIWRDVPSTIRQGVDFASVKSFVDSLSAAILAGTVNEHREMPISSMRLSLDEVGQADATAILQRALVELAEVEEASRKRVKGNDKSQLMRRLIVGLALFRAA
jgi:hypothetical protein